MTAKGGLFACLLAAGASGCAFQPVRTPVPRVLTVEASYPGAGALLTEQLIGWPLETALSAASGVTAMMTRSGPGKCLVLLRVGDDVKVDAATEAVRRAVDRAEPKLPVEASATLFVSSDVRTPDLAVVLTSKPKTDPAAVDALLLADQIERLPGVARCWASGRREPELSIELRRDVAVALGVTVADVVAVVKQAAAGNTDLSGLTVKTKAGKTVPLRDVAQFTLQSVESYTYRLNGQRVGLVGVWLRAGASAADIGRLRDEIRKLKPPPGADRVFFIEQELVPIPPDRGPK